MLAKSNLFNLFSKTRSSIIEMPERVSVLGHSFILRKDLIDKETSKKYIDYQREDKPSELLFKTYLISMPNLIVLFKYKERKEEIQ